MASLMARLSTSLRTRRRWRTAGSRYWRVLVQSFLSVRFMEHSTCARLNKPRSLLRAAPNYAPLAVASFARIRIGEA